MRHPELRQEGEKEEPYIHRIAKLPTLGVSTLLLNLFWVNHKKYHSIHALRDWIKQAYPKTYQVSYVYWQNDYETVLRAVDSELKIDADRISITKFAQWIVSENVFDSWRALGEEPSDLAELFVELVLAKAIDRKKPSKSSRKKSHPSTDRGRLDFFKSDEFIPLVEQVLKENPDWQNHQVLANKKVEDALDMCGFPKGTPSNASIKRWIGIARKNVGAKAKIGRPSK
jgi:hypothetical protein